MPTPTIDFDDHLGLIIEQCPLDFFYDIHMPAHRFPSLSHSEPDPREGWTGTMSDGYGNLKGSIDHDRLDPVSWW